MSFLALALTVCTPIYCNVYNIDTFDSDRIGQTDCKSRMNNEVDSFTVAWNDISSVAPLREWLNNHSIFEEPSEVESYDFECKVFEEPEPNDYDAEKLYAGIEQ